MPPAIVGFGFGGFRQFIIFFLIPAKRISSDVSRVSFIQCHLSYGDTLSLSYTGILRKKSNFHLIFIITFLRSSIYMLEVTQTFVQMSFSSLTHLLEQ